MRRTGAPRRAGPPSWWRARAVAAVIPGSTTTARASRGSIPSLGPGPRSSPGAGPGLIIVHVIIVVCTTGYAAVVLAAIKPASCISVTVSRGTIPISSGFSVASISTTITLPSALIHCSIFVFA